LLVPVIGTAFAAQLWYGSSSFLAAPDSPGLYSIKLIKASSLCSDWHQISAFFLLMVVSEELPAVVHEVTKRIIFTNFIQAQFWLFFLVAVPKCLTIVAALAFRMVWIQAEPISAIKIFTSRLGTLSLWCRLKLINYLFRLQT